MIKLPTPPTLVGTAEQQLKQLERYLKELTELLQIELNRLNISSFDAATQKLIKEVTENDHTQTRQHWR